METPTTGGDSLTSLRHRSSIRLQLKRREKFDKKYLLPFLEKMSPNKFV